jgi:hypothetical protein
LEDFANVGHLPQREAPGRFITTLEQFIGDTEPAPFHAERWHCRLRIASGPARAGSWMAAALAATSRRRQMIERWPIGRAHRRR